MPSERIRGSRRSTVSTESSWSEVSGPGSTISMSDVASNTSSSVLQRPRRGPQPLTQAEQGEDEFTMKLEGSFTQLMHGRPGTSTLANPDSKMKGMSEEDDESQGSGTGGIDESTKMRAARGGLPSGLQDGSYNPSMHLGPMESGTAGIGSDLEPFFGFEPQFQQIELTEKEKIEKEVEDLFISEHGKEMRDPAVLYARKSRTIPDGTNPQQRTQAYLHSYGQDPMFRPLSDPSNQSGTISNPWIQVHQPASFNGFPNPSQIAHHGYGQQQCDSNNTMNNTPTASTQTIGSWSTLSAGGQLRPKDPEMESLAQHAFGGDWGTTWTNFGTFAPGNMNYGRWPRHHHRAPSFSGVDARIRRN